MAEIDDVIAQLPVDQIASRLGVDPETATQAIKEGGATILSGLHSNAQNPEGALALQNALQQHQGDLDVNNVDEEDGQKILGHVFGKDKQVVESTLTKDKSTAGIDFGKLLPMIAPIIMNLLAKKSSKPSGKAGAEESSGGGLSDILGGLLGGLGGGKAGGGFDLSNILGGLGGLFGGKK